MFVVVSTFSLLGDLLVLHVFVSVDKRISDPEKYIACRLDGGLA
jgi:hypothetical protein